MDLELATYLPLEALDPISRMTAELQDRGGTYSYTAPGWAAYKGVVSKAGSHAALSALTLLSFLFFLNLLQQQLTSGQQQTLLFMVNNTAPVNREGKRMKRAHNATFLAAHSERRLRDLRPNALHARRLKRSASKLLRERSTEPSMPALEPPHPLATPPTAELTPPVMLEGLPRGSALQLSAWLSGQMSADQLMTDLADTLANCRAAVACIVHRDSNNHPSNENTVRKLLLEAGEFTEVGRIKEACASLLHSTKEECTTLARAFTSLLD
ncbi:Hypothetical predicted protein [Cloeon dipterum]|uniref:Uncharacterized protein n=1 Tax=Cloeon dipterum TaxID=197152 RepID=A0A8S1CTL9_9INSE|nr:Hypothetical predicted protein [Cloeon dipterum]